MTEDQHLSPAEAHPESGKPSSAGSTSPTRIQELVAAIHSASPFASASIARQIAQQVALRQKTTQAPLIEADVTTAREAARAKRMAPLEWDFSEGEEEGAKRESASDEVLSHLEKRLAEVRRRRAQTTRGSSAEEVETTQEEE